MKLVNERYELEIEEVKEEIDEVSFYNDKVLQERIKNNSRKIYHYIYSRCYSRNRQFIKQLLNTTKEGYNFMKDVLMEQLRADLESGYNDITKQPTVDTKNFRSLDRDVLFANQVSPDVELMIDNAADYLHINIMYQGWFGKL